jgi:hypothetical protein
MKKKRRNESEKSSSEKRREERKKGQTIAVLSHLANTNGKFQQEEERNVHPK